MLHQVLKKFRAEGRDLVPGDIVETSHWKNERLLLQHRFIGKPSVPQQESASVVAGANVEKAEETTQTAGANSQPEPPKATPTKPETPVASGKPAVLRKAVPVAGKVPVAKAAN